MSSKLDKLSFEDFQQSMMDKGDNVTPILHNRELIERAVQERYSLKSIYTYMKSKSLYSGNYNSFYGVCYRYIFKKKGIKNFQNMDVFGDKE